MEAFTQVSLADAIGSLRRRPGLLIGPSATRAPGDLLHVLKQACKACKLDDVANTISESNYGSLIDNIRADHPAKLASFESEVRLGILALKPAPDINHLAGALWSACVSLTEDVTFEAALRTYLDSVPGTRTLTVIDEPRVSPPLRTVPVYKLLGNAMSLSPEAKLVLGEADLLVRQQDWRLLLASFSDHIRDAPLFVVGLAAKLPLVRQVLSVLQAMPHPRPSRLIFLKDDPCLADATVAGLCRRFETVVVDASLRELCAQISRMRETVGSTASTTSAPGPATLDYVVAKHSQVLTLVPNATPPKASQMELPRIVEALFRPAAVDWRPFQQNLDIRRTVTDKLAREIASQAEDATTGRPRVVVVRGEAGVGKTTTLKRVAIDMACASDQVTLWCARSLTSAGTRAFRAAAKDLREWANESKGTERKFIIFCDDPWGLRLDVAELTSAFEDFAQPLVFVFGVRNTEYGTTDALSISGSASIDCDVEVPYELDSKELVLLAQALVAIGAAKDLQAASREVSRVPSQRSSDILCSMWYLVPETRLQLTESLRDEYCRLGAIREAVGSLASTAASSSAMAHSAYELVTVTSSLDIGMPVEVLVRALGVSYGDWIETVGPGRPLWGLLYDVHDSENDTIAYFTRNEVVTRILLELVNGPVGHAGQFGALRRLLAACNGGSLVYRGFALSVLIRARKKLAEFLTYEQGMELFEIARAALPYEDRALEHHRGIWVQDVGKKDDLAYRQFEKALATEVYPGSERDAPKEHIHTSMAAAVVKLIRNGQQDAERGVILVTEHLRQATSARFFNPHTSHVAASLRFDLAKIAGLTARQPQAFAHIVGALQEIERARLIVGARKEAGFQKDLEMMADLERRVLSAIPDAAELAKFADALYEKSGNQSGFEAAARRMLVEATQTSKGRDFNQVNEYLNRCMDAIEARAELPTADLLVVRVDLMVRWAVLRFRPVNWIALREDLADILKESRYRDDVIRTFFYAVALYQCGEITEANALFATLRRWQPTAFGTRDVRCYFLGDDGNPRRFQGTYKHEHRWYFEVPELNAAILSRPPPNYGAGATAHTYIGFAINGPLAQADRPDARDLIL